MSPLLKNLDAGGAVDSIAVSPDGARIAAAVDNTIIVWDVHTGQMVLGPLEGHSSMVDSVAFSHDGHTIASSSVDETIRVWDAETGDEVLEPIQVRAEVIECVTFSRDNLFIISGDYDAIRWWNARTGAPVGKPVGAGRNVSSIANSPNGERLAAACDSIVKVYDAGTRTMLFQCTDHMDTVSSVAFSADGRYIVSASHDGTVRIWEGESGNAKGDPLIGHAKAVLSVACSPDGRLIASAGEDNTIWIWDVETGTAQCEPFRGHTDSIYAVTFTPNARLLISGSQDQTLKIWDIVDPSSEEPAPDDLVPMEFPALEVAITPTTTLEGIITRLSVRRCSDMTARLDLATCRSSPISHGRGDTFRCALLDGTEVAIRTMRLYVDSQAQYQKKLNLAAHEIYTWAKLRHPNVQPMLGPALFRNTIGLITAWESNGSLPQYLKQHDDADRCSLIAQMSAGLSYLHSSRMIHGDLKGVNVLMTENGVPQLANFSEATLQRHTLKFTKSVEYHQSLRWAAPELLTGAKYDTQTDIYALGMTILETITNRFPWDGSSEYTVRLAVLIDRKYPNRPEEYIPTKSKCGGILWKLLEQCWKFKSESRPMAHEVVETLKAVTREGLKRE